MIGALAGGAACGSAGFLCESFDYLKSKGSLTTNDLSTLQTRTFYGKDPEIGPMLEHRGLSGDDK